MYLYIVSSFGALYICDSIDILIPNYTVQSDTKQSVHSVSKY